MEIPRTLLLLTAMLIGTTLSCTEKTGPMKNPATITEMYGPLQVQGHQIFSVNREEPVALHGMSLFWSQWIGKYYNKNCVKWLRDDWQCTVVRAAMGIGHGGYLENPVLEMSRVRNVVEACIDLGIYVIIDWHDHNAHEHTEDAIEFFTQMAELYGDEPNVIYEIYNEPEEVSWPNDVKPYAEAVIAAIRKIDEDNLILVGSPHWSQDVDIATADPIDDSNLAYSVHYYAATHKQSLRNKVTTALNRGFAIFVSEFGVCLHTGDGEIDYQSAEQWFQFMDTHKISWCKWSVADKDEGDAALLEGASSQGQWQEEELTESGQYIRSKIIANNSDIFEMLDN